MKIFLISSVAVALLLVGAVWFSRILGTDDPNIVAQQGLHWHPKLMIYVDGEQLEIPENTGLVGIHKPMHTHNDLPIIHLEFDSRVTKDDIRLGNFFKVWGKDFDSFGSLVSMMVNGEENTDFENYEMRDRDEIILRYESPQN